MSCSSKFPCLFCESEKIEGVWKPDAPLRTFGNISEHTKDWLMSGGNKGKAKEFTNCVETPLIFSDDDSPECLVLHLFYI